MRKAMRKAMRNEIASALTSIDDIIDSGQSLPHVLGYFHAKDECARHTPGTVVGCDL